MKSKLSFFLFSFGVSIALAFVLFSYANFGYVPGWGANLFIVPCFAFVMGTKPEIGSKSWKAQRAMTIGASIAGMATVNSDLNLATGLVFLGVLAIMYWTVAHPMKFW